MDALPTATEKILTSSRYAHVLDIVATKVTTATGLNVFVSAKEMVFDNESPIPDDVFETVKRVFGNKGYRVHASNVVEMDADPCEVMGMLSVLVMG